MKCAMVILNYRDAERACWLATVCSEYELIEKVVVVDNCSNDGSFEKLSEIQSDKVDVIASGENHGFASGNNIGAKYVLEKYAPEYILFANTDTRFSEDNVAKCICVLQKNEKIGLVSTNMVGADGVNQNATYEYPTYSDYIKDFFWLNRRKKAGKLKEKKYKNAVEIVDIVRGSFMFFRAEALQKAGFFDENTFLYCEELIISTKLNKEGYKVAFIPDVYYVHDHIENGINSTKSLRILYESRLYYARKYFEVSKMQEWVWHILATYSVLEQELINKLKGKGNRG